MNKFHEIINRYKKTIIIACAVVSAFFLMKLVQMSNQPIYYEMEYIYTLPKTEDYKYERKYSVVFHKNGVYNTYYHEAGNINVTTVGLYMVNVYSDGTNYIRLFSDNYSGSFDMESKDKFWGVNYKNEIFACKEATIVNALYIIGIILPLLLLSGFYFAYPLILKKKNSIKKF